MRGGSGRRLLARRFFKDGRGPQQWQQQQARSLALAGARPQDGESADWIVYPREREGRNYGLNRSLNRQCIVPRGDAFLNPSLAFLAGKAGGGGKGPDPSLPARPALEAGSEELSFDDYDAIAEAAQGHLSSGVELFVADGSVGSWRGASLGVRVVTDDAALCAVARNLLVPAPPAKFVNASSPLSPIVVYATASGRDASAIQYMQDEGGQLSGAHIVVSGAAVKSQATLAAAIEKAASSLLPASAAVVPGSLGLRKGAKTALYIGSGVSAEGVAEAQAKEALYAAHGCIWTSKGLSSFWGGAVTSNKATVAHAADNLVPSPAFVFVTGAGAAKPTPQDVADAMKKAGASEQSRETMVALLESSKAQVLSASSVSDALGKI